MLDDSVRPQKQNPFPIVANPHCQGNIFNSFASGLSSSAQRAGRAFGTTPGGTKQMRIILYSVGGFVLVWLLWKTSGWWWWSSATAPAPDP